MPGAAGLCGNAPDTAHGGEAFLMRDLVAELRASGAQYRKDTVYKTIRRMSGRTGRSDWAEFEQVESGALRLRPGVALLGAGQA